MSRSDTGISLCDPANGRLIAGVDEAGRGPLAGPVIAAAVILHPKKPVAGLADSKTLSPKVRERLSQEICRKAHGWAIGRAEAEEIDRLNILRASLLAMRRAVLSLPIAPGEVWVDGIHCPELSYPVTAVVKGDTLVPAISAASILAKVVRDREMVELDQKYPGYGFAIHKGYPTRAHLEALQSLGVSPIHRRSFGPVRQYMLTN